MPAITISDTIPDGYPISSASPHVKVAVSTRKNAAYPFWVYVEVNVQVECFGKHTLLDDAIRARDTTIRYYTDWCRSSAR